MGAIPHRPNQRFRRCILAPKLMNYNAKDYIKITADDEEPNCIRCFNQDICKDGKSCGPRYGWRYYVRYEPKENNNN